ncbi:lamin tail domain-containing protein [Microbacterium sp. P02]|uniref:lamin tail domain-containing protein n=1 Tax=Microbacterium sp. P02 TaxID=3366260 RepID=UPI00366D71ED
MRSDSPLPTPGRRWAAVAAALGLVAVPLLVAAPAQADPLPPAASTLVINEVESNGDDTDWVEVYNTGAESIDLTGYRFLDSDDTHAAFVLPAGSLVAAGGFLVIDQTSATNPVGFDFGLGGGDVARIFASDGTTLVASYAWETHAAVSYGRCPDGVGDMQQTTASTKGAANDCSSPVRINEIESRGDATDWVELVNTGTTDVDLGGFTVKDDDDTHTFVVPAGTTVAAGGFYVADVDAAEDGFGLGGADSVRLFAPNGSTLLDSYSWTEHASTTYGRCPDGTGEFTTTAVPSKNAINVCTGLITPEAWPGGAEVRTLDDADTFPSGDLSGLYWEASGTAAPGTLWAVQNGDGLLYRIVSDVDGGWAPDASAGWAAGKVLHYADGTGAVDAEGVTMTDAGAAAGVYVSSERDNDDSGVSRPSVLRYDASGSATSLNASQEWNLAADFPGLGANAGLEAITWISDASLVAGGFIDATTGAPYAPASYPGHGDGLFFVGVEGTASVYAYALQDSGAFTRVATIATPFAIVAEVQFDADAASGAGALWVACDDACDGQTAVYELTDGVFVATHVYERPAGMGAGIANEGFAIADDAVCAPAGTKPTFYADDNDTDGFSLRQGTFPCTYVEAPVDPTDPTDPTDPVGPSLPVTGPGSPAGPVSGPTDATGVSGNGSTKALAATGGSQPIVPLVLAGSMLIAGGALVALRRRISRT